MVPLLQDPMSVRIPSIMFTTSLTFTLAPQIHPIFSFLMDITAKDLEVKTRQFPGFLQLSAWNLKQLYMVQVGTVIGITQCQPGR